MSKETMQLALDEFKHIKQWCLRSLGIGLVNENVLAALEEALAKQEQELALQKLHDENERLGLYKDAYGEEHKESVRLQCVVCNTVYADGVPPQVAKQEQGEPVAIPEYVRDAAIHLHENGCREPLFMVKAIVGWINNAQKALAKQEQNQPATKDQIREAIVFNLPLYTTPQPAQKPWVGLTDEDIRKTDHHMVEGAYHYSFKQGAEWAEAKLKEKNT